MSPVQAAGALARVESIRAGVRGRRAPGWFPILAGLLVGMDVAALAATREIPLAALPGALLAWFVAWLIRRMSVQVTGVRDVPSKRLGNLRLVGEAVGLCALCIAVWAVCRLGGGSHATCIIAPAVVGAAVASILFALRNRALPPGPGGAHAR
ncbi:hypothetical protein OHR86_26130 [Streptomyces sp. NBC_00441]|uniref:hypothetical protein n=1 Tax=Streptomyces sp. NBC_00441 TaxID=2975742 RepID=UPI002E2D66FD|nr:hypothetical protein [Streptomyces sp. NBC_00441]